MEYKVGDIVKLKRTHPCGSNIWEILCVGMDFKLNCCKCHHTIMLSRVRFEEAIEMETDMGTKNNLVQNGCYIQNIQNPSIEQQKLAMDNTVAAIQFIDKPNNDIIAYALSKDPSKMKKYSKKADGNFVKVHNSKMKEELMKLVLDADETIQERIVNTDGRFIGYINEPSEKLQHLAVENNPLAIEFIKKPSIDLIEFAEELSPRQMELYFVNDLGNMQKASYQDISELVAYLNSLPDEKIKKRIEYNPYRIKYLSHPSLELQRIALSQDISLIKFIKPIHPDIVNELYHNPKFDVYSLDDFPLQIRLIEEFDRLKKNQSIVKATEKNVEKNDNVKNIDDIKWTSEKSIKKVMAFFDMQEKKVEEQDCVSSIICSEDAINIYLNMFAERFDAKKCIIASGYIYKSGLQMISPLLSKVYRNQGKLEIIAGSLKDYYRASTDNKLVNMDLDTARYLNMMISEHGCNVYTMENKFYHGKYYFIEGESMSCCMIGSSNLTASGFTGNYELNTLYFMKNNSEQYNHLNTWFQDFLKKCILIESLSECNFTDTNLAFDTINAGSTVVSVDVDTIENEVQKLTDDEVKFRLNLWLNKKPTNIYRKLDIENLKDYVAFEFKDYNLIVFESFVSGNGYYYFDSNNIFETIEKIKQLSKTEIFQMSDMNKRGYHVKDANTLVKKVDSLFHIRSEIYEFNIRQSSKQNTFINEPLGDSIHVKKDNNSLTEIGIDGNQNEENIIYTIKEESIRCPIHNTKMEIELYHLVKRLKILCFSAISAKRK